MSTPRSLPRFVNALVLLALLASACSVGGEPQRAARSSPIATPSAAERAAEQPTTPPRPTSVPAATEAPTAAPAVAATQPDRAARRVATRTRVRVTSAPAGVQVLVNGKRAGETPATVALKPGRHRLTLRARGRVSVSRLITVRGARSARVHLRLPLKDARVIFRAGSRSVRVTLDGRPTTPARLRSGVRPGRHVLSATAKGYGTWQKRITLKAGSYTVLKPRLRPLPARLIIASRPGGAKVYVDNKLKGLTPATFRGIKPGVRKISIYRPGYVRDVRRIRFGRGGRITIRERLERARRPQRRLNGSSPPLRHRPLAVMVENHPNSRPQSGLDFADVVLEAPAEYGISRFIAFFISRDVPVIGPVRSARGYFVLWAKEFNPLYFHAGGSPGAAKLADDIQLIRQNALWDARGFYRTSDRVAPHNLYTSTGALLQVARQKGRNVRNGTWGGLRFKRPGTLLGPEAATYARLTFNDYYYAEWRWDPSRGVYRRWMQGEPHVERSTGAQVTATAVIVRIHQIERVAGDENARESVAAYGRGAAYVMQDGRLTRAMWVKKDSRSPTLYYDRQGNRLTFNKGGIWIQVIPQYGAVNFR